MYLNYLKIYKKLEEAQEGMIHAQKRQEVLKVLDSVMARILELKLVCLLNLFCY